MPVAIRPVMVLDYTPAAALAAGVTENVPYTAARPFFVNLVISQATATNAGSTSQLLRDTAGNGVFVAVTPALVMATSGTTGNNAAVAAGLATASYVVAATDVLRCAFVDGGGGGGANGRLTAHIVPMPIVGA